MQTINDRLIIYCEKNNKPVPYGQHENMIGIAAVNAVRESGKEACIQKTPSEIWVNGYSDEAIPIVDEIIEEYFADRNKLLRRVKNKGGNATSIKYLNYDVEDYKSLAFEEALKYCGFPVAINFNQKGVTQYKIEANNPVALIKLGKRFQKERFFQLNRERKELALKNRT